MNQPLKIVSLIEATNVNAVAKGAIQLLRTAREMADVSGTAPVLDGSFITFDRRTTETASPNEFVQATRTAGIEIDVIAERKRFDLSVLGALRQIAHQRQPDLIITHAVKSHFLLWRSGLATEYPWLAFHHGYTTTDRKMRIYNRLDRWSVPKADAILTVCQAFARELAVASKLPENQILVLHNAIRPKPRPALELIDSLRKRLNIGPDERVVLSVGRLSKEKAHAILIDAFGMLSKNAPDLNCKLVIVGEGPERSNLEAAARDLTFPERVILIGQVADVQPFYALANVFVLSSLSEGSPNALLEAMAANAPVVASAVGGVPEIVSNDDSALLVNPNNPQALAKAIIRILSDAELARRLKANAAALIVTQHTPETYLKRSVEIYSEVIKRRGQKSSAAIS
jgi:glycosyltransferase involved in cell wall biosynthesis